MSRIGRLPVAIPAGVTVEVAANNVVTVTGPKGTLVKELPVEMEIKVEGEEVVVTRPSDLKKMKSLHGLTRTLINNAAWCCIFNRRNDNISDVGISSCRTAKHTDTK